MITRYQIENVILGSEYSKARKLMKLETLQADTELLNEIRKDILDGETVDEVMTRAEEDDRTHWITFLGKKAAADLLTLGKVQPETMLEMSLLPEDDFREAVKTATGTARKLNDATIAAERELNTNTIEQALV